MYICKNYITCGIVIDKCLSDKSFNEYFETYWSALEQCGIDIHFDKESLKNELMTASGGLTENTGIAFSGGLLSHIYKTILIQKKIYKLLSNKESFNNEKINENSILKVLCLMHLSKIDMFVKNDKQFEINNGKIYKFSNVDFTLKFGEWSILKANNLGISFTPYEFEAMKCFDNMEKSTNYFECPLSTIVRQSNELAYLMEKFENK